MKNRRKFFNGYLFLLGFAFIYVALELFFYILECAGMGYVPVLYPELIAANKNFAHFDSLSGYKWVHDDLRFIRIHDDYIVYDNKVTPNLQGYISQKDFYPLKDTGVSQRFLVFGDSFTGGEYLKRTWPDQVENFLAKENPSSAKRVELYSFAQSGSGLPNWYQIFRKEAIPTYEFDGIIFAIYGDNLNRGFAIMESRRDTAFFNWFGSKPPENNDDYEKNFKKQMWSIGYVLGDVTMDSINAKIMTKEKNARSRGLKPPGFYFLHFLADRF